MVVKYYYYSRNCCCYRAVVVSSQQSPTSQNNNGRSNHKTTIVVNHNKRRDLITIVITLSRTMIVGRNGLQSLYWRVKLQSLCFRENYSRCENRFGKIFMKNKEMEEGVVSQNWGHFSSKTRFGNHKIGVFFRRNNPWRQQNWGLFWTKQPWEKLREMSRCAKISKKMRAMLIKMF